MRIILVLPPIIVRWPFQTTINPMADYIMIPTMGEILQEEFMKVMNISAYKLAQEIHVPVSRIQYKETATMVGFSS